MPIYLLSKMLVNITSLKCGAEKYPFLATLFDVNDLGSLSHAALTRVREHAVQLAPVDIWDRIEELRRLRDSGPSDFVLQAQKENILVRLQRLLPGTTGGLSVMRDKFGDLTSDPAEMAGILNEHWGSVFSRKDVARHKIASWLVDGPSLPAASDARWKITREHVTTAVKVARESAPGPDGIPYRAWKALGDLGINCLFDAAVFLQRPDSVNFLPLDFNQAFLCCSPKKPSGTDPTQGEFYDAKNTRPLSLVNTDNRLIANAYRLVVEPIAGDWVSQMQRGFLRQRSLSANVIDIVFESMRVSLKSDHGMLILFDFEAAFPSLSREYMMDMLQGLGLPSELQHVISCLYKNNTHLLKLKGEVYPSICTSSGVRQGCPLSPLHFIICIDPLLRRLSKWFPDATARLC